MHTHTLYTHAQIHVKKTKPKPNPSTVGFRHGSCLISFSLGGCREEEACVAFSLRIAAVGGLVATFCGWMEVVLSPTMT